MRRVVESVLVHAVLALGTALTLFPLLWMVSTSFKGNTQIFAGGDLTLKSLVPSPIVTKNYPEAMQNMPFLLYLRNTMVLCISTA